MAAAASCPMCPMIAVYEVNPIPQSRKLPSTGSVYRQKSRKSLRLKVNTAAGFRGMKVFS